MTYDPRAWKLKRTAQCQKCPWRVDVNPRTIPDGYSVERHRALESTIARPGEFLHNRPAMECHEGEGAHCIGWLVNQTGRGNNIPLRLQMRHCTNADRIRVAGEQHPTFEDTIPHL